MNNSPCNDAFKTTDIVGGGKLVLDILNQINCVFHFYVLAFAVPSTCPASKKKKKDVILLVVRFVKQ